MAPKPSTRDYQPVTQAEDATDVASNNARSHSTRRPWDLSERKLKTFSVAFATALIVVLGLGVILGDGTLFGIRMPRKGSSDCPCKRPDVPQYFQAAPELWAGPTPTGKPAFLAQTRTFNPTATYVPNAPLQTDVPIEGMGAANRSIFELMG